MSEFALSAGSSSAALDALHHAITVGQVDLPKDGRVLFLRARDGHWWGEHSRAGWVFQQTFKPFAKALERSGLDVREAGEGESFDLVMILPPRQREEARALFANALRHVSTGGVIIASMANDEGARSGEADFRRLLSSARVLSKHHCRVFWSEVDADSIDQALRDEWRKLDEPRAIAEGKFISRPGLFAWNRIDPASALLAAHLPENLRGRAADLGAGYGYLACELLRRCAGISSVDLYEAEARALEPARINLASTFKSLGRDLPATVHWHDVSDGLLGRYDVIISNPPFHQGRADQPELGQSFIAAAARALDAKGSLWLVANRHLPYENTLARYFKEVQTVTQQHGFKVFCARGVRA